MEEQKEFNVSVYTYGNPLVDPDKSGGRAAALELANKSGMTLIDCGFTETFIEKPKIFSKGTKKIRDELNFKMQVRGTDAQHEVLRHLIEGFHIYRRVF